MTAFCDFLFRKQKEEEKYFVTSQKFLIVINQEWWKSFLFLWKWNSAILGLVCFPLNFAQSRYRLKTLTRSNNGPMTMAVAACSGLVDGPWKLHRDNRGVVRFGSSHHAVSWFIFYLFPSTTYFLPHKINKHRNFLQSFLWNFQLSQLRDSSIKKLFPRKRKVNCIIFFGFLRIESRHECEDSKFKKLQNVPSITKTTTRRFTK